MSKVLQTVSDGRGNELIIRESSPVSRNIFIKLKGEARERNIGTVDVQNKVFVVKRSRSKHLHEKSQSYGFNEYILKTAQIFTNVRLQDETGSYLIPVSEILLKGKYQFYKAQGFELQLFLPLNLIEKFREPSNY